MEKYSHGAFEITGYHVTIPNLDREEEIVMGAWARWMSEDLGRDIIDREYPSLHAVYYNYISPHDLSMKGYDMLIGYITRAGSTQELTRYTTVEIPAQDYRYTTVTGPLPDALIETWMEINDTPATELARSYGYDLDMYNADGTEVTVAVSVSE